MDAFKIPSISKLCKILTVLFLVILEFANSEPGDEEQRDVKPVCKSNGHVCTSLMKYPDETVFDEGPYCTCAKGLSCSSSWNGDDFKSLTWQHYERADKMVQYRFCMKVIPQRNCADDDEIAVFMVTETAEWLPYVREARCACPNDVYQLLGWWRHPTHTHDNKTGLWVYEYGCNKEQCSEEHPLSSLCAKVYMAQHDDFTLGYMFQCACPKGYKCQMDGEEDETATEQDSRGKYIPRYCQPVHKGKRR